MYSLTKKLIMEFFISDFWKDNFGKVFTTFGFSFAGTGVKAVNMNSQINSSTFIDMSQMTLVDVFQIGSYLVSMIVGVTVIWRFIIFLNENSPKRKYKNKKNGTSV